MAPARTSTLTLNPSRARARKFTRAVTFIRGHSLALMFTRPLRLSFTITPTLTLILILALTLNRILAITRTVFFIQTRPPLLVWH